MITEKLFRRKALNLVIGITIFLLMLIGPVDAASGNRVWKEVSQFPGNYTIEVLGQKKTVEVKEVPFNVFLVLGIIIVIGAVIIYMLTAKGKTEPKK